MDSQITSSSEYSTGYSARYAKPSSTGWVGNAGSPEWLLVDFLHQTTLTSITVQGSTSANLWSSQFSLEYSNDGYTFQEYRQSGSTTVSYQSSTT